MAIKVGMRGDTLIEVMLAVGIFSMVAVAVVSVMSSGTSSSQTALEATLAREEIDAQAETLRFIHRGYIADVENGNSSKYYRLWTAITNRAVNAQSYNINAIDSYATFTPQNCADLYDSHKTGVPNGGEAVNKGFILNPRGLIDYDLKESSGTATDQDVNKVLILPGVTNNSFGQQVKFQVASTYPHLVFGGNRSDLDNALYDHSTDVGSGLSTAANLNLYSADGIYLIAVKDPNATSIVHSDTNVAGRINNGTASAYYDFYIRTCWYGTGDQSPSSISTVIRLYNPDLAKQNN